jgi:hypothetical protein
MTTPLTHVVREKYGEAARRAAAGGRASCGCGTSGGRCGPDPITADLYDAAETAFIPEGAVLASLGCGNPASTCCSRRGAWGRPAGCTGST